MFRLLEFHSTIYIFIDTKYGIMPNRGKWLECEITDRRLISTAEVKYNNWSLGQFESKIARFYRGLISINILWGS